MVPTFWGYFEGRQEEVVRGKLLCHSCTPVPSLYAWLRQDVAVLEGSRGPGAGCMVRCGRPWRSQRRQAASAARCCRA